MLVTRAKVPESGLSVISLLDISERSAMERELAYRANHDLLTGLANKALVATRLMAAMQEVHESGGMVGVLLIDLDRFKQVNDSFGHSLGDKLLRQAAERLTYLARQDDCVARTGGDEFVIVVGKAQGKIQLEALANNVLHSLNRCFYVDEYSIYLSASIGIACYPGDGTTVEALMQSADLAMYRAKAKGKNTHTFFTEDLTVAANDRMALETELFRAMDSAAFEVHYQPKIDIANGAVAGCEALVRWKRADGMWIPPSVFIPLAEETGLVRRLDMYVLRKACRQQREWREQGLGNVHMAVNMSGRSIIAETFVDDVLDVLGREDVRPEHLGIEITETAFMSNMAEASRGIAALSEQGIQIYLDDFGTGYSSLYYLHTMPIASLKIDKSFIDGINAPLNASNELVKTVLTLASGLGMATVAEGVETREQIDFLVENGCSAIQGYIFSQALSGSDFATYLKGSAESIAAVMA
ncbi:EAL domain-containing protein [uncultured Desulfovibrio sp.]|uniref:putative bifunctional diguanylate cyclase/phosphodiesterase n=1 Tax=uncultured Desulfovibrio sp. TaxID=167968 RepID=UPI0028045DDF|nr:EAL domain-containing protein [uncultured Desulfovibrio sp.]